MPGRSGPTQWASGRGGSSALYVSQPIATVHLVTRRPREAYCEDECMFDRYSSSEGQDALHTGECARVIGEDEHGTYSSGMTKRVGTCADGARVLRTRLGWNHELGVQTRSVKWVGVFAACTKCEGRRGYVGPGQRPRRSRHEGQVSRRPW